MRASPLVLSEIIVGHTLMVMCPQLTDLTLALVVAYSYHPTAQTLAELHLKNANATSSASTPTSATPPPYTPSGTRPGQFKPKPGQIGAFAQPRYSNRVAERTLWSYVVQIANAIKAVHDAGMAVRVVDATKILVTGKNRCGGCILPLLCVHHLLYSYVTCMFSPKCPDLLLRHCRRAHA
jgi:hypothetical protein